MLKVIVFVRTFSPSMKETGIAFFPKASIFSRQNRTMNCRLVPVFSYWGSSTWRVWWKEYRWSSHCLWGCCVLWIQLCLSSLQKRLCVENLALGSHFCRRWSVPWTKLAYWAISLVRQCVLFFHSLFLLSCFHVLGLTRQWSWKCGIRMVGCCLWSGALRHLLALWSEVGLIVVVLAKLARTQLLNALDIVRNADTSEMPVAARCMDSGYARVKS